MKAIPLSKITAIITVVAIGISFAKASDSTIFVGVLETKLSYWPEGRYGHEDDTTTKRIVRVLFRKDSPFRLHGSKQRRIFNEL